MIADDSAAIHRNGTLVDINAAGRSAVADECSFFDYNSCTAAYRQGAVPATRDITAGKGLCIIIFQRVVHSGKAVFIHRVGMGCVGRTVLYSEGAAIGELKHRLAVRVSENDAVSVQVKDRHVF